MRRILRYVFALITILVFSLLQQHFRVHFYPHLVKPMTPALADGLFGFIYLMCVFVMVGTFVEYIWLIREKRRLSRPKMDAALHSIEKIRQRQAQSASSKSNVWR